MSHGVTYSAQGIAAGVSVAMAVLASRNLKPGIRLGVVTDDDD
jgi:hypothetical protein